MAISPARRIAFDVLRRVEAQGAYASDDLHAAVETGIKPLDAALATELTMGVLRWRGLLDFLLERHSKKPLARLDLPVAIALRLGLYQLRLTRKVPAHAAVHESVELVRRARKSSAAPFVNAILRGAMSEIERPAADFLPERMPLGERLAILYSHPRWLVDRWLAHLGESAATALLEANNSSPRLSCSLNDSAKRDHVFRELAGAHLRVEPGRLLRNAFSVSGGSPSRTRVFRDGAISIQDEASQAVPLLLGVKPGDRVLDLCAAPGGKTAILARAAGGSGSVLAADLYEHRLRACKAQFTRLHLENIFLVAIDAEKPLPFAKQFDPILVDAPCSGTGTLARHPEIRWRLKPEQLDQLHRLQVAILRNAVELMAPGGKLLYSTCSMEPEENERVIEEAMKGGNLHRSSAIDLRQSLEPQLAANVDPVQFFDDSGAFRTSPARDGSDGFFAALFVKDK